MCIIIILIIIIIIIILLLLLLMLCIFVIGPVDDDVLERLYTSLVYSKAVGICGHSGISEIANSFFEMLEVCFPRRRKGMRRGIVLLESGKFN